MKLLLSWACEAHSFDGVLIELRKLYLNNISQVQGKGKDKIVPAHDIKST